jgi:hypothetical protein
MMVDSITVLAFLGVLLVGVLLGSYVNNKNNE